MKTVRGLVLGALIGALVMTVMPVAAAPQPNNPSGDGVQPTIIPHFGGDDCVDPVVGTEATHSLRIPNPASGTYTDPRHRVRGGSSRSTRHSALSTSPSPRRGGWHSTWSSRAGRMRTITTISLRRSGRRPLTLCCIPHRRGTGTTISATSPSATTSLLRRRWGSRGRSSTTVTPTEYSTTTTVRSRRVSPAGPSRRSKMAVEVASAVTGSDGTYLFALEAGTYVVCEVLQEGRVTVHLAAIGPSG